MIKADVKRLSLSGAMAACEELHLPTSLNREEMIASLEKVDLRKINLAEGLFLPDES